MRSKIVCALTTLALGLLAALSLLETAAGAANYTNLLLVTPIKSTAPGFDTDKLEKFCEDEFLVTYEIRQEKSARALNSSYPVTVIGTNACYPDVLGYSTTYGCFFTKAAWEAESRYAALNEAAAFKLFGSANIAGKTFRVDGETWLVTGVILDGDTDNANIYAPSSVTGGQPKYLTALMGGEAGGTYTSTAAATLAGAKNALKSLGVHDSAYELYDLSRLSSLYNERFSVAWMAALAGILVLTSTVSGAALTRRAHNIKSLLHDKYLVQLATEGNGDFLKMGAEAVITLTGASGVLALSVRILEICLGWRGLSPVNSSTEAFAIRLSWLQEYHTVGLFLFAAFLSVLASVLFLFIKANTGSIKTSILSAPTKRMA